MESFVRRKEVSWALEIRVRCFDMYAIIWADAACAGRSSGPEPSRG
jgi:hypothetical protein